MIGHWTIHLLRNVNIAEVRPFPSSSAPTSEKYIESFTLIKIKASFRESDSDLNLNKTGSTRVNYAMCGIMTIPINRACLIPLYNQFSSYLCFTPTGKHFTARDGVSLKTFAVDEIPIALYFILRHWH